MVPVSFNSEKEIVLSAPPGQEDWCDPLCVLPVKVGNDVGILSCWKVTAEELAEINRTGRVYIIVYGGGMPPIQLFGTNPIPPKEGP